MTLETSRPTSKRARRAAVVTLLIAAVSLGALAPAEAARKEALTLWWVIFNNPEACTDGCDGADLFDPAVQPSVVYASGAQAKPRTRIRLVASLYEQADGFEDGLIAGPGLLDAEKAEIHLVVRSHGSRIARRALEQVTQFLDGGCQELGGPNLCQDIQFAVHTPGEESSESAVFWFPNLHDGARVERAASYLFRDEQGIRVVVETKIK